jgi:glucose uptake protein
VHFGAVVADAPSPAAAAASALAAAATQNMEPWKPSSFGVSFVLALASLACWGSWSNTAKAAAHIPFSLFYLDFSIGIVALAGASFLSIGAMRFAEEEAGDCTLKALSAVGAGALFNVANVLLVIGIQLAGLTVAFPVGIGLALVLGTVLTFIIDPHGNDPLKLFAGVALAFFAILSQVKAKLSMEAHQQAMQEIQDGLSAVVETSATAEAPDESSTAGLVAHRAKSTSSYKALAICVVCGLLMSLWSPLSAYSMAADGDAGCSLTPYASFLLFTGAAMCTSLVICKLLMLTPIIGERSTYASWVGSLALSDHSWGLAGGVIWAVGTLSNLISGDSIGMALSYAVGQAAPMVATLWGLFYYHEFRGAPLRSKLFVALMFALYIGAILLIAWSK